MINEIFKKIDKIHPYPAKFTLELAYNLIDKYSKVGEKVYDPFLGSGTTILACNILRRMGFGTDINHIAILISKFKMLELSEKNNEDILKFIKMIQKTPIEEIKSNSRLKNYKSINHWFKTDAILALSFILNKIEIINDEKLKIFFSTVFSSILNTISNQESDTRYAAIEKDNINLETIINLFVKKAFSSLEIQKELQNLGYSNSSKCFLEDSANCNLIISSQIDLIVTSPPYPNTYDYYLYHKHRMLWLGFDPLYSMKKEIGSRREFSSLKRPKDKFNNDLLKIFESSNKILKNKGKIVVIIGDGKIDGEIYKADENLKKIGKSLGWKLIDSSFTLLDETSKSFQKSYRTLGKKEHILVFEKLKLW